MTKILIAGDYYPNRRVKERIDSGVGDVVSKDIEEIIHSADLAVVNYESPMTEGIDCTPIKKAGPTLCSNKKAIDCVKSLGFGLTTLANNHTSDYGEKALLHTIDYMKSIGIATVGAGKNLGEAGQIYYHNDEVAVINCCEHEFGIAETGKAGANPLSAVRQYYQIVEARKHTQWVIVIIHGGSEHFQYPTPRMKELYRFFVDAGADVVVNAHQHCYAGYERYHGKPIFYGLGNFCFDSFTPQDKPTSWNYGYMVMLHLDKEEVEFEILPYHQCGEEPVVRLLDAKERKDFFEDIERRNTVVADSTALEDTYKKWISQHDSGYRYWLRPFQTDKSFLSWLKGISSFYLNKGRKESMLNCMRCESHYDIMIRVLESKL